VSSGHPAHVGGGGADVARAGLSGSRSELRYRAVWKFVPDEGWGEGLPSWSSRGVAKPLGCVIAVAFAIRLYLSLTSYCISGDGVAYLTMARQFASGDAGTALHAVFSPLYPMLVAAMHVAVTRWELAGEFVSVLMGTAAVASIYAMTWEAFARRDLALGAAALTAIHPAMAAFSASVRTEAGYIFLVTTGVWLMLRGLRTRGLLAIGIAGALMGLAYLYRTEGIGLPAVALGGIAAGAWVWRRYEFKWAIMAGIVLTSGFMLVASPYLIYLRSSTGHWTVGREFTAAMMYGMGEVANNPEQWRRRGDSSSTSALGAVLAEPRLYLEKVADGFVASAYGMVQALDPLLTVLLALGLGRRGWALVRNFPEALLAGFLLFYFCGFALSYTGARFMGHLVPFTLGWVTCGAEVASAWVTRLAGRRPAAAIISLVVALVLLPRTLWPIGYDMRGIRYAGEAIAQRETKPHDVVGVDGRGAWYAEASFVPLPEARPANLCGWIGRQANAGYAVLSDRDENRYGISRANTCLHLIGRYPRGAAGHYDLFAISRAERAVR